MWGGVRKRILDAAFGPNAVHREGFDVSVRIKPVDGGFVPGGHAVKSPKV